MEASLILAAMLRRYRFAQPAGWIEPFPSITLRPADGMPMTVTRR
jgi:cytochrome P450